MRIVTWNVERLRHKARLPFLLEHCRSAKADILILTETDRRMLSECIDHIAVSERFLAGAEITVDEWNRDKALSDHDCSAITVRMAIRPLHFLNKVILP